MRGRGTTTETEEKWKGGEKAANPVKYEQQKTQLTTSRGQKRSLRGAEGKSAKRPAKAAEPTLKQNSYGESAHYRQAPRGRVPIFAPFLAGSLVSLEEGIYSAREEHDRIH